MDFAGGGGTRGGGGGAKPPKRQLNNELLEARLRAWPMSRVLSAVEEAIRETLAERRRAAGLDREEELFGAGSARVPVADPSATETDGDGTNGPLNEPGLAAGETRARSPATRVCLSDALRDPA